MGLGWIGCVNENRPFCLHIWTADISRVTHPIEGIFAPRPPYKQACHIHLPFSNNRPANKSDVIVFLYYLIIIWTLYCCPKIVRKKHVQHTSFFEILMENVNLLYYSPWSPFSLTFSSRRWGEKASFQRHLEVWFSANIKKWNLANLVNDASDGSFYFPNPW